MVKSCESYVLSADIDNRMRIERKFNQQAEEQMNIKGKCYTRTNDSGTHYARIILPKELRAFVTKAAIWRSLATKEDAEARDAGTITAIASRTVFQEAANKFLKEVTVVVEAEIVGEKFDLDTVGDKVSGEETTQVAESLRVAFGITSGAPPAGSSTGSSGNSSGSSRKSTSGSTRAVKSVKKKSAAGQESSDIQSAISPKIDNEVAHYIEKRPHGYYRLRYWIPRPLHSVVGQREFRVSLGTKEREAAIMKASPMVKDLRERIERLRVDARC